VTSRICDDIYVISHSRKALWWWKFVCSPYKCILSSFLLMSIEQASSIVWRLTFSQRKLGVISSVRNGFGGVEAVSRGCLRLT